VIMAGTQNEPHLSSALAKVKSVVEEGVSERDFVAQDRSGGILVGACLAPEFVARYPAGYGGVIAFTGGLIGPQGITDNRERYVGDLAGMPAFLGAGDPDAHVPWDTVTASAEILGSMGASVIVKRYAGMPHTINGEEIELAKAIVTSVAEAK
jgi:phospholipase/carboxylesterase